MKVLAAKFHAMFGLLSTAGGITASCRYNPGAFAGEYGVKQLDNDVMPGEPRVIMPVRDLLLYRAGSKEKLAHTHAYPTIATCGHEHVNSAFLSTGYGVLYYR